MQDIPQAQALCDCSACARYAAACARPAGDCMHDLLIAPCMHDRPTLKMFLARMFSTHAKHTACSHGLNATRAGTSSRQIMHSSSPSFTRSDSWIAARPWPHTVAVVIVCAIAAGGGGRGRGRSVGGRSGPNTAALRSARVPLHALACGDAVRLCHPPAPSRLPMPSRFPWAAHLAGGGREGGARPRARGAVAIWALERADRLSGALT